MSVSPKFIAMLEDILAPLGSIGVRRMFSGAGVYCDGVMFGLVADDVLHLKTDTTTRAKFEAEGCGPFAYDVKGRTVATSYWRVPERLYDEPDELVGWSRIALGVAGTGRAQKSKADV